VPSATLVRALSELRARRSVVIGYHGVAGPQARGEDPENLRVSESSFRRQLELLRAAGFRFVTVAGLAQAAEAETPPPGLAALSFDDGMEDNHSVLLPLLEEYEIPATVYVTTGMIGRPNPWLKGERMMTELELVRLTAAGVEIGAHTVSHPDLSALSREDCRREMAESRDRLERLTGSPVRTFAYPFCRYGEAAVAAAADAGFLAAVTCGGRGSWRLHELKRAMITGKDGLPTFLLKLADAYQPLFDSLAGRAARAGTRGTRRRLRAIGLRSSR